MTPFICQGAFSRAGGCTNEESWTCRTHDKTAGIKPGCSRSEILPMVKTVIAIVQLIKTLPAEQTFKPENEVAEIRNMPYRGTTRDCRSVAGKAVRA